MADGREAALINFILLLDGDEVKTRGKTWSWIKRWKQERRIFKWELRIEDIASFKEILWMDYERNGFLGFDGQILYNMIKVCTNAIKVYVSLRMLERPSSIFERVQRCCNGLYGNVTRCANRSNILFLTCCRSCCMACLNSFPRV